MIFCPSVGFYAGVYHDWERLVGCHCIGNGVFQRVGLESLLALWGDGLRLHCVVCTSGKGTGCDIWLVDRISWVAAAVVKPVLIASVRRAE